MPYNTENAPDAVKALPKHAQEIWISAYNAAYEQYKGDEGRANATAWAAVKEKYQKDENGTWRSLTAANMDPKEAQIARSKKYGISIREDGHITKPSEWANVPDDEFLDPVNYAYPCPDADQTRAAAVYWGRARNKAQYSEADQKIIDERLDEFRKKYKIGPYAEEPVRAAGMSFDEDESLFDYVRVSASAHLLRAAESLPDEDKGYKWHVQIIEAGPDKQGNVEYPYEVLKAAAPLYEGARVFALSQGQHTDSNNPYGKSVRDLVGWLSDVKSNGKGLEGYLNILKTAKWLRDALVDAFERGKNDLIGLSHDVLGKVAKGKRIVESIIRVDSVDVVYDPIAGGKFLRMAAARDKGQAEKEGSMLEKILAALKKARPEKYKEIEGKVADGTITEDEVISLLAAAAEDRTNELEEAKRLHEQMRITACGVTLQNELKDSGLPDLSQTRIKKQFGGKIFEAEALQAAIKEEKEYIDKLTGSGTVSDSGQLRMGNEEPEKIQAAFDKMLGVQVDERFKDVPQFMGIRAAYVHLTGDENITGVPDRKSMKLSNQFMEMMRMPAAFSSSTFTYVLGNSLYRRLIQDYKALDFGEQNLISYERNAKDFRTLESVRIGYFGDLPDVNPENADYTEITAVSDEEISYAINQKGVILTVTRKYIINDDLKSIATLISRLGRAARRTFAQRGWDKIITNATYKADNKALFHNDHGNLGAVALTNDATGITTLYNRLTAMFNQTEKNSGKKLGLRPRFLWIPIELEAIAYGLNSPWPGVAGGNPHAGRFGANHERIITLSLTTDANDWGLIADKNDVELLEVAYLNGQKEPELFVADNPLIGQMFVADKIQYKQRHEYEWEIADYRGLDKSVIA